MAAVRAIARSIEFIKNPTQLVIKTALTDKRFIDSPIDTPLISYEYVVKRLFKDNSMLMNKWLRYREVMKTK
jgi:hypothetical protein